MSEIFIPGAVLNIGDFSLRKISVHLVVQYWSDTKEASTGYAASLSLIFRKSGYNHLPGLVSSICFILVQGSSTPVHTLTTICEQFVINAISNILVQNSQAHEIHWDYISQYSKAIHGQAEFWEL